MITDETNHGCNIDDFAGSTKAEQFASNLLSRNITGLQIDGPDLFSNCHYHIQYFTGMGRHKASSQCRFPRP
jgi:hypothetical protein